MDKVCVDNCCAGKSNKRKSLNINEFDPCNPETVYFITIPVAIETIALYEDEFSEKIVVAIYQFWRKELFYIYSYCLMPDHLHLAVSLKPNHKTNKCLNIVEVIDALKQYTTETAQYYGLDGSLWDETCYDNTALLNDKLNSKLEHILNNPVRKHLVKKKEEWQFSGMIDPLPS